MRRENTHDGQALWLLPSVTSGHAATAPINTMNSPAASLVDLFEAEAKLDQDIIRWDSTTASSAASSSSPGQPGAWRIRLADDNKARSSQDAGAGLPTHARSEARTRHLTPNRVAAC